MREEIMKFYVILVVLLFGLGIQNLSALPQMWQNELAIRQGIYINWSQTASTDSDGNMIIVWSDAKSGERKLWAQKVDIEGNFLWNNGQPLLIANGLHLQINPIIISTSDGDVVIAWITTYYPSEDPIYAQKLTQNGEVLWQQNGVTVCEGMDFGIPLRGCSDNAGGVYLAWNDRRNTSYDIYAAHILANGSQSWTENGLPIANTNTDETLQCMIADGAGGFIIAYTSRINYQDDLYMNRILFNGNSAWDGAQILSEDPYNQTQANIAGDGTGSFIITWNDLGANDPQIYAHRIDLNGQFIWENPVSIYSESTTTKPQIITSSDTGVIIVWEDIRNDYESDLFAQKLSVSGELLWNVSSVPIAVAPCYQQNPMMVNDANGGCFIVWDDSRNGDYPNLDVYAQHVLSNGSVAWEVNGHMICNAAGEQSGSVIRESNCKLFFSWADYRNGSCSIYYQVLTPECDQLLEDNGKLLFLGLDGEAVRDKSFILKRSNDVVVVWEDTRASYFGYQIYFQIVEPDGTLLMPENGRPVTTFTGVNQENPSAVVTPYDEIAITWANDQEESPKVHVQLLSSDGYYLWGETGVEVTQNTPLRQMNPKISYEDGYYYVGWSNLDSAGPDQLLFKVWGQKLDQGGNRLWGENGKLISETPVGGISSECILQDLVGRYFIWLAQDKLYAKLISTAGNAMPGWKPQGNISSKYIGDDGFQLSPKASAAGDGLVVIWEDLRVDFIKNLYAQKYNSNGSLAWDSLGVVVGDYGNEQDQASLLISDGIYIPWRENIDNYENQDIAIQKLSLDGEHLWGPQGTYVIQRPETQSDPAIAQLDNNNLLVAWADLNDYQNDIYMRRITTDGVAQDDALGYLVCNAPYCQYSPQIVSMDNNSAFIIWTDARSSATWENYGLYMQFVDYSSVANNDLVVATPIATLNDNYPNPFNPETTISFSLAKAGKAKLEIFNIKGQKVNTLVDDVMDAGTHKIIWNGKNKENKSVGSGVYFYKLTTSHLSKTKKMILLK
jgi:hypothetical protein